MAAGAAYGAAYVIAGAAYAVVAGAAYCIAGAATMEYEGMNAELVASGMRGGITGATSTPRVRGASSSLLELLELPPLSFLSFLSFFFLSFFLGALFFFLEDAAQKMPMQQHNKPIRRTQAMIGMQDPEKPESTEPRLAWDPKESPEVKESKEPEVNDSNDAEESPLAPDEESLHGATVGTGGAGVVNTSLSMTTGVVVTGRVVVHKAPAMPPPTTAAVATTLKPIPTFSPTDKPGAAVVPGAHGSKAGTGGPGST